MSFTLPMVVVSLIALSFLSGCRSRADAARDAAASAVAEPATPLNPPMIESKNLEVREEGDPPFAKEIKQNYQLARGAKVTIRNFAGKLEVWPSDTNEAQLYLALLSGDKHHFRRKVMVDHSPGELTIRTERESGSRMFQMFAEGNRSERQRTILKIPSGTDLNIGEMSGRIRVENVDGPILIYDIYGPIEVAGISNTINVRNVSGRIGLSVKSLAREGLTVNEVNGTIDVALAEPVNAEFHAGDVNGRIDVDLPNVVTLGEKEFGSFNGKIGKGGPQIGIRNVNGRIRVQTLAKAQSAGASVPPPAPEMKTKLEHQVKSADNRK